MAIKIPIITVFDSKGLKQAQYQLNKVRGNFQNLGRNAAVAGAVVAGAFALIGKSVMDAAESQKVFAQTEAVLKSTGTTANGTAADIAKLSGTLMGLSAVDDEVIQSGANLLLTFKNIQNQAGLNNDIFNQTLAATLDVARAMGTDATTEAIRLGKALNDPVKGISALTRVGIQFTDQQKDQIKALVESGDLMGAQKIILAELQSQFGGSASKYVTTFAGQLELMRAELGNLSEDIGMIVMPAVGEFFGALRDIAPEAGARLKEALGQIDWAAFAKALADLVIFFVQNAEAIFKVVTALFFLNTAYNLGRVAIGLYNGVAALLNGTLFVTATRAPVAAAGVAGVGVASGTASIGVGLLAGAMRLVPWAALATWIGFVIQGMTEVDSAYRQNTPTVTSFGTQVLKTGKDSEWAAKKYGVASQKVGDYANSANLVNGIGFAGHRRSIGEIVAAWKVAQQAAKNYKKIVGAGLGGATADRMEAFLGKKKKKKKDPIFDTAGPTKQLEKLKKLKKDVEKKTAKSVDDSGLSKKELAAQAEAEALEKRKQNYQSFLDSVKSTFGQIRDGILSSFSLPELGGSTDSIIRNMGKLLGKTKEFASNISTLSSMGLNATLLQQVISQGPVAGAKLAASLVAGGVAGLSAINAGYAEMGALSSQIATTGTNAAFGSQAQQTTFNIEVNGGLATGPAIGQAIVEAITAYERTSGVVWTRA